jgi:hypothetical protein
MVSLVFTSRQTLAIRGQAKRETPIISQLSFWSELVTAVEDCRGTGEFPFGEHALIIDWEKVSDEDRERLVGIKNPVKAIERQLNLLFGSHGVADKMEVMREKTACISARLRGERGHSGYGGA